VICRSSAFDDLSVDRFLTEAEGPRSRR